MDERLTSGDEGLDMILGGGVPGDLVPLPLAQLAILPGTNHVDVLDRVEWLASMIVTFLTTIDGTR